MATFSVTHSAHAVLAASVVDIVNFPTAQSVYLVIIRNRGTDDIYYTLSSGGVVAATPAAANNSYICPAGTTIAVSRPLGDPVTQIQLFSVGIPAYSVEGF
jgi:hypothetical protein